MKVAVTYDNGSIFQHFGRTKNFKVYDIEDGKIITSEIIDMGEDVHCALADKLKELNVDTLICGGIGEGAKNALTIAGISLFGGVSGNADKAVEDFLVDKLSYSTESTCNHHSEEHACHHH